MTLYKVLCEDGTPYHGGRAPRTHRARVSDEGELTMTKPSITWEEIFAEQERDAPHPIDVRLILNNGLVWKHWVTPRTCHHVLRLGVLVIRWRFS